MTSVIIYFDKLCCIGKMRTNKETYVPANFTTYKKGCKGFSILFMFKSGTL